jgi:hypothetical protein
LLDGNLLLEGSIKNTFLLILAKGDSIFLVTLKTTAVNKHGLTEKHISKLDM